MKRSTALLGLAVRCLLNVIVLPAICVAGALALVHMASWMLATVSGMEPSDSLLGVAMVYTLIISFYGMSIALTFLGVNEAREWFKWVGGTRMYYYAFTKPQTDARWADRCAAQQTKIHNIFN